jgi:DEAD/DEAH box helicase domain-containing protein
MPSLSCHYLVLMDAVPSGTGYLKTLYQEKDTLGHEGEGIMDILRRARDTLETCRCQRLQEGHDQQDTDGCYRCIRAYHLQYSADRISRKRGLQWNIITTTSLRTPLPSSHGRISPNPLPC